MVDVGDALRSTNICRICDKSVGRRHGGSSPDVVGCQGGYNGDVTLGYNGIDGVLDIVREAVNENLCTADKTVRFSSCNRLGLRLLGRCHNGCYVVAVAYSILLAVINSSASRVIVPKFDDHVVTALNKRDEAGEQSQIGV